ncbi:AI-2E family transporter [Halosegnis marinus]|uniref:AI-2E family transporter n=1 Tax=Halosegnis marinus TaxID=3034023 RepID=A0ABD5ZSR5_9EURY|nr:AI-2E family transporter [Halosegnis sp. DT85]
MALSDVDRSRTAWWAIGGGLAVFLAFVAYSFVGTLVFAVFLYYATRPVYNRVSKRVGPPSVAAALSLFALALPLLLLVGYALAIGLQEFNNVSRSVDFGPLESALGPYRNVTTGVADPGSFLDDPNLVGTVQDALGTGLDYAGFVGTGLLHLFVMFAVAFYLLRDAPRLSRWLMGRFGDDAGVLDRYARAVDRDLYKVFSGNIFNAVFTAAIGAIVYSVLDFLAPASAGIPYPALVGLLAGAASLVPVVGMKLVYVPVGAYLFGSAYLSADPNYAIPAAFVLLSFVVVDTIPDLVLRPYVSGRNLHVGLVMFAYIFGPLLFGWYGIFLGPLLLVLVVHFARLVLPELVSGTRIQPFAVDPAAMTELPMERAGEPSDADATGAPDGGEETPDDDDGDATPA